MIDEMLSISQGGIQTQDETSVKNFLDNIRIELGCVT